MRGVYKKERQAEKDTRKEQGKEGSHWWSGWRRKRPEEEQPKYEEKMRSGYEKEKKEEAKAAQERGSAAGGRDYFHTILMIGIGILALTCLFLICTELVFDSSVRYHPFLLFLLLFAFVPFLCLLFSRRPLAFIVAAVSGFIVLVTLVILFCVRTRVRFYTLNAGSSDAFGSLLDQKPSEGRSDSILNEVTEKVKEIEKKLAKQDTKGVRIFLIDIIDTQKADGKEEYDEDLALKYIKEGLKSFEGKQHPILKPIFAGKWKNKEKYIAALKEIGNTYFSHLGGNDFVMFFGMFTMDAESKWALGRSISEYTSSTKF